MDNDSWLFPEDLPFDSLFDSDGDGKITGFESFIRDNHWLSEFEDEEKPIIPDYLVEEGDQYCIYPENYDSVEAFEADLEEAKEIWGDSDEDDAEVPAPTVYKTKKEYEEPLTKASLKEINQQIQESQEKLEVLQKQLKLAQEESEQAAKKKKTTAKALYGSAIGISFLIAVIYSLTSWGEFDLSEIAPLGFWLSLSFCCFITLGYSVKINMDKEDREERFFKGFHMIDAVQKEEQKLSKLISAREQIEKKNSKK